MVSLCSNRNPKTIGDFNTLLSLIYMLFGQKLSRKTSELKDIVYQMELTDICRVYPNTQEYIFYSVPHRSFSKLDHILEWSKQILISEQQKLLCVTYVTIMW